MQSLPPPLMPLQAAIPHLARFCSRNHLLQDRAEQDLQAARQRLADAEAAASSASADRAAADAAQGLASEAAQAFAAAASDTEKACQTRRRQSAACCWRPLAGMTLQGAKRQVAAGWGPGGPAAGGVEGPQPEGRQLPGSRSTC